jgi:tyrosinase
MAVTRPNVVTTANACRNYARGVILLKKEFPGPTTTHFGIPGPATKVSTYDLFVVWHHVAMMTFTPPGQSGRNSAHGGPVFLPWHRFMLRQLELNLQRVLQDNNFGLPYWDWAADGQLPPQHQPTATLWTAAFLGGTGSPVSNGPFTPQSFRVKVESLSSAMLQQADRGLIRELGKDIQTLPTKASTSTALNTTPYDAAPWSRKSSGFRNLLEGWPNGPALHNRVHVFVGGDMSPATSPNDPVFFLNHCNVDRIWEAWMQKHGRTYLPGDNAPATLKGHRLHDQLTSLISAPTTPAAVLDVSSQYVYDSLSV